jgi:hypothetical protein
MIPLLLFAVFALMIIVVVLVALAAGLTFFVALGPGAAPLAPALGPPILVLLGIAVLLLLVLLWCCCSRGKVDGLDLSWLARLLPNLRNAGPALEQTAAALEGVARALNEAKTPVTSAGDAAYAAGDKVDITVPTIGVSKRNLANFGDVVTGIDVGSTSPLGGVKDDLHRAGDLLRGPGGLASKLDEAAQRCNSAAAGLRTLKAILEVT